MPPKPKDPTIPSFGDFQASSPASPTSGDASDFPSTSFELTASTAGSLTGLRSPDRIDNTDGSFTITNSVGVQSLPPEELATLQADLKQAGLTPDGFQISGVLDADTKKALLELKRDAASSGMSDMDALRTRITMAASAAEASASGGPSVTRTISEPVFTDPLTARAVVRDAMQTRLGRAPTADEYHQFRKQLSNSEAGQDVSTTTSTVNAKGVAVNRVTRSDDTTDPSASDVADKFTRTGALGREANTVQAADFYDIIASRVGG